MGVFKNLNIWQKGAFFGFLFSIFIGLIFTVILILYDIILNSKNLSTFCYAITKFQECNLTDAIFSKIGFFVIFIIVIGIPVSIIGGLIGFLIDKIKIQ